MVPFGYYQWLAIVVLIATGVLEAIRRVFLPPHRRGALDGKRWQMPPGPAGLPLFGNLLQYRRARRDEVELRNYVSLHIHLWLLRRAEPQIATKPRELWRDDNPARRIQDMGFSQ